MKENIELQELQVRDSKSNALLEKRDLSLCGHVNTSAEIVVCRLELSVKELLDAKAGNVLVSAHGVDAPMTLVVNGKPVALGNLVVVEDKFGFEITHVAE